MSDKAKAKSKPAAAPASAGPTVRLHRVFATKPEKAYRAFLDADGLAKWLPPYGFTCHVEHMDAKVGGTFKMSFKNFTTGNAHSFGGEYVELVPRELIRLPTNSMIPSCRVSCTSRSSLGPCLAARRSTSSSLAFPPRFRSSSAISAGSNRWCSSRSWWRRIYRGDE